MLAALRAWLEGLSARVAVEQYLPGTLADAASARGVIGAIRRQLQRLARSRQRPEQAAGIDTLAALTLRVPRRRRWWLPLCDRVAVRVD